MDKVLIVYASRCGSTGEVAQAIAQELTAQGREVDVRQVGEVADLGGYQAVLVGSAVRFGKWLPKATKFVEEYRQTLGEVPTAFFTVHALAIDDSPASQQKREAYLDPVHKFLSPKREAFFAGKIDPARLNFAERTLASIIRVQGDLRDWDAIRRWARQVGQDLSAA
jgi:menaquinone-dependent protoporphyrinogen oxidase